MRERLRHVTAIDQSKSPEEGTMITLNRRTALKLSIAGALATIFNVRPARAQVSSLSLKGFENELGRYPFTLPALPFAKDALEPVLDAQTFELHHDKHHQAYITNLNNALKDQAEWQKLELAELAARWAELPEGLRDTVRNNAGGALNHQLFWRSLTPGGAKAPISSLATAITAQFGTLEALNTKISEAATKRFGSGWAWLVLDAKGQLAVISLANQDSPLAQGLAPVFGIDVWEHAYYLKFQNRRADFVKAALASLNWTQLEVEYMKGKALLKIS
jgi:superoxide dismutase, Fe-Mn family